MAARQMIATSLRLCSTGSGSCCLLSDFETDRTGYAGAADAAIAVRVLRQILLVIVLGVVELRRGKDLGRNRAVSGPRELLLVRVARLLGDLALRVIVVIDSRSILRAYVVPLTHPLSRVVPLPERLHEIRVRHLAGIENHQHGLGVPCGTAAHFTVRRVRRVSSRVANRGGVDARNLPEHLLGAPETTEGEQCLF